VQQSGQVLQTAPPVPHVVAEEVWQFPLASQHPAHDVLSHTHAPAVLHSWPAFAQFPLMPVHLPPAPSEPPQATPLQFGLLHVPSSSS